MKNKGPDFICIGLQKTGTTWLNKNLKRHPQVFLPPTLKEIRYFWEKCYLPGESVFVRFSKNHWFYRRNRKHLFQRPWYYYNQAKIFAVNFLKMLRRKHHQSLLKILTFTLDSLVWDFKYLFLPHNDNWYLSLFNNRNNLVCGEISPIYYLISEDIIKEISNLIPDLKLLIFLRNPIEYSWSLVKMRMLQLENNRFEDFIDKAIYAQLEYHIKECPSFKQMIDKWRKCFPAENIYIDYYDNLLSDTDKFFNNVCTFIGVEPEKFPNWAREKLPLKVHQGVELDMPDRYARFLANRYRPVIAELIPEHSPYADRWLEMCDSILNNADAASSDMEIL